MYATNQTCLKKIYFIWFKPQKINTHNFQKFDHPYTHILVWTENIKWFSEEFFCYSLLLFPTVVKKKSLSELWWQSWENFFTIHDGYKLRECLVKDTKKGFFYFVNFWKIFCYCWHTGFFRPGKSTYEPNMIEWNH